MNNKQKLTWIILLLCQHTSCEKSDENKEDLTEAEAKDGLEIVKTIKKINNDGSYTIGYESDDGSFKIESRDVLGNVKGTYGYVDEKGDIKRVSYSTNNLTDIITESPSVVQRIPKTNKTTSSTKRPTVLLYNPTSSSIASSATAIPKRRPTQISTSAPIITTQRSIKNVEIKSTSTTQSPSIVYATSAPLRNILYQRPLIRSTSAPQLTVQKSEGQIIRPELSSPPSTELPIIRRLSLKNPLLDSESATLKPVTELPEARSNLLRRQLPEEKNFDARHHVLTLQQGLGDDSVDVYSSSLTTGTARPLFTTTFRPRLLPTTQSILDKPSLKQPTNLSSKQQLLTTEFSEDSSTTEAATEPSVQNFPEYQQHNGQQGLIAVRHPYHEGVVLVPANQIRVHEQQQQQQQYILPDGQYLRQVNPTPTSHPRYMQNTAPIYLPRPPMLNSVPVQVDQNGYVRPLPAQIFTPAPFHVPMPIASTHRPNYENNEIDNEVDHIKPPVSTKEFQKLIEVLIVRQKRLENANALINAQRQRDLLRQNRLRNSPPIFLQKTQGVDSYNHPAYTQRGEIQPNRHFIPVNQIQHQENRFIRQQTQRNDNYYHQTPAAFSPAPSSLTPTRRVSRLLHNKPVKEEEEEDDDDEYLPPQIREMLLLRMLQLAINPSLPVQMVESQDAEASESSEIQVKRPGVRNVEVLGEEEDEQRSPGRSVRLRGHAKSYYE